MPKYYRIKSRTGVYILTAKEMDRALDRENNGVTGDVIGEKKQWFTALRISRDDFEILGYDASKVSDKDMQDIADQLGEEAWGDQQTSMLEEKAGELGLPLLDND